MMNKQAKTGNKHSDLLDTLVKTAMMQPQKKEDEFDISAILNSKQNEPTLQEIFEDVVRSSGKNVTRTAQFGGNGGMAGMKPMPEPAVEEDAMFDDVGDIGEPSMEDELGGMQDELGGGGDECDQEAVKQHLVDALVSLCGSPEEAAECVTNQTMPPPEGLPGEESLDEPLGGEIGELGGPPEEMAAEMPSAMPAPTAKPAPMPAPM